MSEVTTETLGEVVATLPPEDQAKVLKIVTRLDNDAKTQGGKVALTPTQVAEAYSALDDAAKIRVSAQLREASTRMTDRNEREAKRAERAAGRPGGPPGQGKNQPK